MIKIIATDMDHTLLDDKSILPKDFSQTLTDLEAHDIEFVVASGRTLASLHHKVQDDKNRISFVSDNGSVVEYKGSIIYQSIIETKSWQAMVRTGRQLKEASIVVTTSERAYIEVYNDDHFDYLGEYYPDFKSCDDVLSLDVEVIKVTFMSLDHTLENYEQSIFPQFGTDFNTSRAGHIWIDLMNQNVNKGNGLKILLDRFNLKSDNLMTFGDYHNDIEMLQLAKYSFAVSNAHQDVKDVAKEQIGSNNENSVIKTIYDRVLTQ